MQNTAAAEKSAYDVQMSASRWVIERRASENWSEDDQRRLDAWLNESTAHLVAYWRADQAWDRTFRAAALRQPFPSVTKRDPSGLFKFLSLRIAASLIVIATLSTAAAYLFLGPKYVTYTTPVGGREILRLSDGSRIELNTNTVLRFSTRVGQRQAILDKGEAYFEIKHDPAHPFTVKAGGRQITDVGTKFLVRGEPRHLEVALLEGRVLLSAPNGTDAPAVDLTPGSVAIATAADTSISKRSQQALKDELGWRQGVLVFHHTTLATVVAEFNRYNTHKLVVDDPRAALMTINGTFRAGDVETFTEVAQDVLHLRVQRQGDETVMSR